TDNAESDTQSIPGEELLTNGATYYVGDCRYPITVTVNNAPRPANNITNSIVSGFEFTFCTPASFNSDDLADLFVPLSGYRIEVYATEVSIVPLNNADLTEGDSYFVGQVPTTSTNPNVEPCPSF